MLSLRPDLGRVLSRSAYAESDVAATWLTTPPAGYDVLRREIRLPSADVARVGAALLDWRVHRSSGLRVVADGPAHPGTTVALGARLGPLWAVAPCRVVATHEALDQVGFTYVTLPGHPEHGIEQFLVVRDGAGARFRVHAVARPSLGISRRFPVPHRGVQRLLVRRYLDAAFTLARENS